MSVNKDDSGRRWVQAEVEVPGTPDQVWAAIATGPGVSSWFVPTEIREDGTVVSHFGPGMDAVAKQTLHDPPRTFAAESEFAPGGPIVATQWFVEAKSGDVCVVRVVHSLFASTNDWDDQLENIEKGWPDYFEILRLYLTHFAGATCRAFQLLSVTPRAADDAWRTIVDSLGLRDAVVGGRFATRPSGPRIAGVVERGDEPGHGRQLLLRIDEPNGALAHLFSLSMGGATVASLRFYWYGESAAAVAAREEPLWRAWLEKNFPTTGAVEGAT